MSLPKPSYEDDFVTLYHGDCQDVLPKLADASIDLVLTDPPYFRVKNEAWDRQWNDADLFIEWIGECSDEWQRVLKPNGSLYCFASPNLAARVECEIAKRLNVLNRIRWTKDAGWHNKTRPSDLRSYLSPWEEIIFAEQCGADGSAMQGSGYAAACAELSAGVFEPLRAYLANERDRAGFTTRQVAEAYQRKTGSRTVTGMAGHWFEVSQWALPTEDNYDWLRELFNANGDEYLRREYEDLRTQYEDLRRPFFATPDAPYTDVWTFKTVSHYAGKHPCEKPTSMLRHIIGTSSREDAVVLDPFAGSGSTLAAARDMGRRAIGVEKDAGYCESIARRLSQATLLDVAA